MAGVAVPSSKGGGYVPTGKEKLNPMVYITAMTAALAGLLFGLDIGVIAGALDFIGHEFTVSDSTKELIVSALLIGAVIGTFCSGPISRKFGRRKAILLSGAIFVIGSIGCGLAHNPEILIFFRGFLGVAVGIASFTAPLYLSEMAPMQIRGRLIAMYQLMITIGIVLAFVSDTILSYGGHWRIMLAIVAVPAAMMAIGVYFLPESPRWLALAGFKEQAMNVLRKLRSSEEEVKWELGEIENSVVDPEKTKKVIANPNFKKALILGICLQAIQQFTGINVVMYYAPQIFKAAGFDTNQEQMFATIIVGVVNVLATFIAIAFVDKLGRKPILYIGHIVMGLSMGILGILFFHGMSSAGMQYSAVGMVIIFIIGFAMSAGPIIWIICSEIYPLAARDFGITASTASNWFCNAIVGMTFLTMLNGIGPASTFGLYAVMNIAFMIFYFYFTPETKDISLEEIEENLLKGAKMKEIGTRTRIPRENIAGNEAQA